MDEGRVTGANTFLTTIPPQVCPLIFSFCDSVAMAMFCTSPNSPFRRVLKTLFTKLVLTGGSLPRFDFGMKTIHIGVGTELTDIIRTPKSVRPLDRGDTVPL